MDLSKIATKFLFSQMLVAIEAHILLYTVFGVLDCQCKFQTKCILTNLLQSRCNIVDNFANKFCMFYASFCILFLCKTYHVHFYIVSLYSLLFLLN